MRGRGVLCCLAGKALSSRAGRASDTVAASFDVHATSQTAAASQQEEKLPDAHDARCMVVLMLVIQPAKLFKPITGQSSECYSRLQALSLPSG